MKINNNIKRDIIESLKVSAVTALVCPMLTAFIYFLTNHEFLTVQDLIMAYITAFIVVFVVNVIIDIITNSF
jgi:hypothetical protein